MLRRQEYLQLLNNDSTRINKINGDIQNADKKIKEFNNIINNMPYQAPDQELKTLYEDKRDLLQKLQTQQKEKLEKLHRLIMRL